MTEPTNFKEAFSFSFATLRGICCLLLFGVAANANAAGPPASIAEFLDLNCTGCHDASTHEGGLDLDSLTLTLEDPDNFHLWQRVFDRVGTGEMPPDEDLDQEETTPFLASLHQRLKATDSARIASEGRVSARRLTRSQYERNVCELLAIDIPLRDFLPEESYTRIFDTVSKSQQVSDHSMAAYLQAADAALEASFNRLLTETEPLNVRLDWNQLRRDEERTDREPEGRPQHQDIVSWSTRKNFYGRMPATSVPTTGRYRVRMRVRSVHPPDAGRVWCSVQSGVCNATASTMYWVGSFEATGETSEYELEAWIREGHMLRVVPNDRGLRQVPVPMIDDPAGTVEPLGMPGVSIKWIEIRRVEADRADVQRALLGDLELRRIATDVSEDDQHEPQRFEIESKNPEQDLRNTVESFAQRAFRRPVTQAELRPTIEFALKRLQDEGSMLDALRAAYRTILCSPQFLYFEEAPGVLDDYALANRLSHFLWGIGPDEELRQWAAAGRLSDPAELRRQTDRLLDDSRSKIFVEEFTDQWLMLHEINSTTPDSKLYPEYDDVLHHTLPMETYAFVHGLIEHDLPVRNIVDSDFTFLNSRLARHYDIEWPGGMGMQRVKLGPLSRRGGIITHASVLKVTANGTTTSPIIRGVWMLERVMGEHIPPPPANVSAVEPDIRGATSIRDQIDKHKSLDSCAACHVKIDPPGFALESYDVIGGWRERYRAVSSGKGKKWVDGMPVDPSHEFASGESFDSIEGLKQIVSSRPEQLARALATHLATYSTGAAPTFADRETLDAIVAATESTNYGVRSLIHEVIQSSLFQQK
ncbi:DUF1592 domain-containing protein [Allorhodopirellula solitaria]|uniref:DUF1592 domain-containing protein n=1 Tax=Allorhodopirellula solitaria TaxID=2527987 RepID=UPI001FE99986|nr:DUF1592 domain-containing protein [Allorhodopirellula solitaria]